ncbi:MAG: hypothetical protein RBR97_17710 [Bacteroidales bacterium]|jgi:hypothetical protein|nr:hypothetical protein [Bacteroidales bacterium]
MKKRKNRMTTINRKKDKYQIQIWVEELSSWLVFDNFSSRKMAKDFLASDKEMEEVETFIARSLEAEKDHTEKMLKEIKKSKKRKND